MVACHKNQHIWWLRGTLQDKYHAPCSPQASLELLYSASAPQAVKKPNLIGQSTELLPKTLFQEMKIMITFLPNLVSLNQAWWFPDPSWSTDCFKSYISTSSASLKCGIKHKTQTCLMGAEGNAAVIFHD